MALQLDALFAQDRENSQSKKEGVYPRVMQYSDFLEFSLQHPEVLKTAHQRVYDRLVEAGVVLAKESTDPRLRKIYEEKKIFHSLRIYKAFEDFFGIEEAIDEFMNWLKQGAQQGLMSRSMFYGVGPVGSGKSSLFANARKLLDGTVFYTLAVPARKDEYDPEAVEVISEIIDGEERETSYVCCTHNCNPLYLLPRHLRIPSELEHARQRGEVANGLYDFMTQLLSKVTLFEDGNICGTCQYRLRNFRNDYMKFMVVRRRFSSHKRLGTVEVTSVSDPQSVDISQLIGSIDSAKMELYSPDDPRALRLNGALNLANGGLIEFIEIFKAPDEFLKPLNTATQEKKVPVPGRQQLLFTDLVITAHSNPEDFAKFQSNPTNKAMLDRLVKGVVPYNLRLEEEIRIYEKLTTRNTKLQGHKAPHALRIAAAFAVLTRYVDYPNLSPMNKMRLYNGEQIIEKGKVTEFNLYEIMKQGRDKGEGMKGIGPRFIEKAIESGLGESMLNPPCIIPPDVLKTMVRKVMNEFAPGKERDDLLKFLQDDLVKFYNAKLEEETVTLFANSFDREANDIMRNYENHLEMWALNQKVMSDPDTGEDIAYDESKLKIVEEALGITNTKEFREGVNTNLNALRRRGHQVTWRDHAPLREGIEKFLVSKFKPVARAIIGGKHFAAESEEARKQSEALAGMRRLGYQDCCIDRVLNYIDKHVFKS